MAIRVKLELIKELTDKKKMSLAQVSRRADLGYTTVYKLYNGQTGDPSIQTVAAIARVLGVEIKDLIEDVPESETGQIVAPGLAPLPM